MIDRCARYPTCESALERWPRTAAGARTRCGVGAHAATASCSPVLVARALEPASGLDEEDVVERGGVDLEVRDLQVLRVQRADDLGELVGALVEPHGDAARPGRRLGAEAGEHLAHALAVGVVDGRGLDGRPADLGLELIRRALGDDLAGVDDPDPIGERVGLLEVLGGEEDGDPVRGREPLDLIPKRGAALHVEAGGGLVQEQDRGLVHQREREVQAPAHAARVAADLAVRRIGQPDARDQLVAAAGCVRLGEAVHPGLQAHVLAGGQELVERGLLQGDADRVADLGALLDDVVAGDPGRAGGRRQQRRQHVNGGRLAGSVGAEKAVDLARRDRQVDPVDGAGPLLEFAHEALDLDPVVGSHSLTSPLLS